MSRYFYMGLVVAVVAVGAIFIIYRTEFRPTESPPLQISPKAEFGGVSLRIEYATTTEKKERGLGSRVNIPDNYGMLFIFNKSERYGFWMKDMLVPIDIFWLDDKGQVVAISSDLATSTYPNVFYPPVPVRYVLETTSGFAYKHAIATGTPLILKNLPIVSE